MFQEPVLVSIKFDRALQSPMAPAKMHNPWPPSPSSGRTPPSTPGCSLGKHRAAAPRAPACGSPYENGRAASLGRAGPLSGATRDRMASAVAAAGGSGVPAAGGAAVISSGNGCGGRSAQGAAGGGDATATAKGASGADGSPGAGTRHSPLHPRRVFRRTRPAALEGSAMAALPTLPSPSP